MPPIHFGSAKYKNLQISNRLLTNNLTVNNTIFVKQNNHYKNIVEYVFDQNEANVGIPGIIKGGDQYTKKQLLTPNDFNSNQQHLYKHILNDSHLLKVCIYNSNDDEIDFQSLNIITLYQHKQQDIFTFYNYNSLDYNSQYTHVDNMLEYIDIEGSFNSFSYGWLLWSTRNTKQPIIENYICTNNNFNFTKYFTFAIGLNYTFHPIVKNFINNAMNKNDSFFIKYYPDEYIHIDTMHFHETGKFVIKPKNIHINDRHPLHIIISTQDTHGNDYGNDFYIKFNIVHALAIINTNSFSWYGNFSNNKTNEYIIYNSSVHTIHIHPFDIDKQTIDTKSHYTNSIQKHTFIRFQTNYTNIGYSFNYDFAQNWNSNSHLKHTKSKNNSLFNFEFLPYKPIHSNSIYFQSFLDNPLDYMVVDYQTKYGLSDIKNNIITYNYHTPIATLSYDTAPSANCSWFQFFGDGYYHSSLLKQSIIYLPYDYHSFEIVILSENITKKTYSFTNKIYGKKSPILFLDPNSNVYFNCNLIQAPIKNYNHHKSNDILSNSMNSFDIHFISFQSLTLNDIFITNSGETIEDIQHHSNLDTLISTIGNNIAYKYIYTFWFSITKTKNTLSDTKFFFKYFDSIYTQTYNDTIATTISFAKFDFDFFKNQKHDPKQDYPKPP